MGQPLVPLLEPAAFVATPRAIARRQAAAAHRSTIQIGTCKAWEEGKCRSVSFVEGARQCRRAHPDELTKTAHIECCSSAARPKPERCFFTLALCPYSPGTHRDSW